LKLIVGLGNPGRKYELTRHNIGYRILDYVADYLEVRFKPSKGEWYGVSGIYKDNEYYLMKPTTFMNNSGEAVFDFLTKNNIPLNNILVVCDDFQIPYGMIRLRTKGSDGGHNGIGSIIYRLNTMSFPRMRVGIGKEILKKDDFVDYVLSDFCSDEIEILKGMFPFYKDCILSFISEDIKSTMNNFNKNFLKKEDISNKNDAEIPVKNANENDEIICN
jgi:peptidyl-tRNA hydrolase, PTH1 family